MNFDEAKDQVRTLTPNDLKTKFAEHKVKIDKAAEQATPILNEARELKDEGEKILKGVEDDRIMCHAILTVQKERKG